MKTPKTPIAIRFLNGAEEMKPRLRSILQKKHLPVTAVLLVVFVLLCGLMVSCQSGETEVSTPSVENSMPVEKLPEEPALPMGSEQGARNAYANVLEVLVHDQVFPDGNRPELSGDMAENRFAVQDVDGDGREELILLYTTTFTAGHSGYVFDFDETTQEIRTQLLEYPLLTFYENGAVMAGLSHNQGWGGRFWPFTLYQYRSDTDSYESVGMVDAWDKEILDFNPGFPSFPDEIDTSGTGFVYYIMEDGVYERTAPVDASVYNAWLKNYIGEASICEIEYLALTEGNIQLLRSQPEYDREEG